ncbi:hypothetical protein AgCh_023428 [Apium graveolens]
MRTNLKRVKRAQAEDRLSNLHDDILVHILSFLDDPKSAAQTCVLSKRWNNNKLWMHLPDVYLNSKTFGENSYEFEKFVDMLLTQREKSDHELRSLSFCWTFKSKIPQQLLDRVHCYAQSHDVRCFDFSTGCASGYRSYPSQNFDPKSLTTLKLNLANWYNENFMRVDSNLNLQNLYLAGCTALKTLWLEKFCIEIRSDVVDLFSGLVNLTELRITGCYIVGKDILFHIRAPRLERLILLEKVDHLGRKIYDCNPRWVISTPMLKYLRIDLWQSVFSLSDLPFVEELEINFHTHIDDRDLVSPIPPRTVMNIIKELSHAKSVTLSKSTIQVLSAFPKVLELGTEFRWEVLKVQTKKELPTTEFPEYLRGLAYLRKSCSKTLKFELIK